MICVPIGNVSIMVIYLAVYGRQHLVGAIQVIHPYSSLVVNQCIIIGTDWNFVSNAPVAIDAHRVARAELVGDR